MIHQIQGAVAHEFEVPLLVLKSSIRTARVAEARFAAVWLCRDILKCSFPQLGDAFRRDHTTMMHAYTQAVRRMERDAEFRVKVMRLRRTIASEVVDKHAAGTKLELIVHEVLDEMMPIIVDSVIEAVMRRVEK